MPPRKLADFEPVNAIFKADVEDFVVEEVPLYDFSGDGDHVLFLIEKRGVSTMHAVQDIARAINASPRDIGYAGLKDARAVTRQWLSLEHVDPTVIREMDVPRIRVVEVTRHTNKLKLGHLSGNRFTILARNVDPSRLALLQDGLGKLRKSGVPNYYGRQRFGVRGDTWMVGRAMVRNNLDDALDVVLGRPSSLDSGDIRRARQAYDAGDYEQAFRAWPGVFRDERRALRALMTARGKKKRGFLAISESLRRFYLSAYQSYLFNEIVAQRLESGLDHLLDGDLAWIHRTGSVFLVENAAVEQPRADAFEISPTGPQFGFRMSEAEREPGAAEAALLKREGLEPEMLRAPYLRLKGGRRPLRFQASDANVVLGADQRGAYFRLTFTLPKGCYATSLLRELFVEPPGNEAIDFTESSD